MDVSRETLREYFARRICDALSAAGLGKDASAAEIDKLLREQKIAQRPGGWHYSTWRRAVRAVCAERARLVEWEGRDGAAIRPRSRSRVRGIA
jgi:predicted RNase H-like nuclease (RuvC/YqgF family)